MNKKQLAVRLSRLDSFDNPKLMLEQYQTPSEIAAETLWTAYMDGDIEDKIVADLGCGNGILGIGALMLGAKKVYFVDSDKERTALTASNLGKLGLAGNFKILCKDVRSFAKKVDTVIQNPPFGVKNKGSDTSFLEKAFSQAAVIYSFHKSSTFDFILKLAERHNFNVLKIKTYRFPIKHQFEFHKKPVKFVLVDLLMFKRY